MKKILRTTAMTVMVICSLYAADWGYWTVGSPQVSNNMWEYYIVDAWGSVSSDTSDNGERCALNAFFGSISSQYMVGHAVTIQTASGTSEIGDGIGFGF